MNFKLYSTIIVLFLLSSEAISQYSIKGYVYENDMKTPIQGAQVFIDGSTIGALSLENGSFELNKIPEGIHDLVARFVGFKGQTLQLNTNQLKKSYIFTLKDDIYEMNELVVKPDQQSWKYNFRVFQDVFLGKGPFSENTIIKNKDAIYFDFDVDNRVLIAITTDRIEIENKDLGYVLYFYLDHFIVDYKGNRNSFSGQAFFEPLYSRRKRTQNKWTENRLKAYQGSFLHFTKSLITKSLNENGFYVKSEKRDSNAIYVSKEEVPQHHYFQKVDSTLFKFQFLNFLNITYKNEYEDMSYLNHRAGVLNKNPRLLPDFQNSSMTLLSDSILIDNSAYVITPTDLLFDGYWSFEKVSDMLPIDYNPTISGE